MATYGSAATTQPSAARTGTEINQKITTSSLFNRQPAPEELKIPQKDILMFFRQLSVILQSGVPIAQGMILISENMTNPRLAHAVNSIAGRLTAGDELSGVLRKYPKVFKPIAIGLIEAGEAGGILSQVLERLAALIEARSKIKGQITGALIYPVAILVLAVSVSLGLLIFIVPKFETMFADMGAELPGITNFMLTLSRIVTTWSFAIIAPLTLFIGFYLDHILKST